ncbi:flavodoxin [Pseudomonas sp. 3A(2025)]
MAEHDPLRRQVIAAIASLPLLVTDVSADEPTSRVSGAKALVVYFSRSGNTRVVAGLIQRGQHADLFEIRPATAYPEDYLQTVEQARRETADGFKPELAETVTDIKRYDVVFLGFPIWGTTAPPVIRSFLSAHDLSGKTIVPFVTHGGYGLGNSLEVVARHAPGARVVKGFVMEGPQERRTMEAVNGWMTGLKV